VQFDLTKNKDILNYNVKKYYGAP